MDSITLDEAKRRDYVGEPKIYINPFNRIKSVVYRIPDYDDNGKMFMVWSKEYLLK